MRIVWLLLVGAAAAAPQVPPEIRALLDSRDYTRAEAAARKELERAPGWDAGHVLLGQIAIARKDWAAARDSAAAALRIRESLDALMVAAVASMRLGGLNESIEFLEKASRRRPDYAAIYKLLAMDYALGGRPRLAANAIGRAIRLDPADWEAHYLAGRALYEMNDFEAARSALLRSFELKPDSARTATALGQVAERGQDLAAAERWYRKASELCGDGNAECAWPLLQLGLLKKRTDGDTAAEPYVRKAMEARPEWAKPHFYLGKALAARQRLAEARTEFETAIRLDGTKSEYFYQLALACRRLGDREAADRHMARFRELANFETAERDDFGVLLP